MIDPGLDSGAPNLRTFGLEWHEAPNADFDRLLHGPIHVSPGDGCHGYRDPRRSGCQFSADRNDLAFDPRFSDRNDARFGYETLTIGQDDLVTGATAQCSRKVPRLHRIEHNRSSCL
jgi:hypothetical protein